MKRNFIFLILISSLHLFVFAQLPVNKPVKILYGADTKQCLQKTDSLSLSLGLYIEKQNQEWKIIPADEPSYYYLQTTDGFYLNFYSYELKDIYAIYLTQHLEFTDDFKFRITSNAQNEWKISPKQKLDFFIQPSINDIFRITAAPKQEFSTTTFIIDTIPYRRPIPTLTKFEKTICEAGVTIDLKSIEIFGVDATFYKPGGMYPAQFIVRIYVSEDKKNKIEIVIYDDIRRIGNKKSYKVEPKGERTQPLIRLFVDDKPYGVLTQATITLKIPSLRNNTFDLLIQDATNIQESNENNDTPVYDIAVKGVYLPQ